MSERPLTVVPPWRWWGGFFVTGGAASYLTVLAYREDLPGVLNKIWQFDKVMHFAVAGLLAFFLDGALRRRGILIGRRLVPLAAIGVLVPSGVEEALQVFSTIRTASLWDFAADVAGVLAFIRLSRRFGKST